MLLGLIFRESAKSKRSITSWRAESKGILPTDVQAPVFVNASPAFGPTHTGGEKSMDNSQFGSWKSTEKAGYGFGRQGEKAAGLRGLSFVYRPFCVQQSDAMTL